MADTESTNPTDDREASLHGLRDLVEFLETHPDVPAPSYLACWMRYGIDRPAAIAQWVAGLDTLEFRRDHHDRVNAITRTFGVLEVHLEVRPSDVGVESSHTRTVVEWLPFTVDELLDRAASQVPA